MKQCSQKVHTPAGTHHRAEESVLSKLCDGDSHLKGHSNSVVRAFKITNCGRREKFKNHFTVPNCQNN